MHMCYVWCVWEKEMTHMGSISNAFFYAISINQIPSKIYFISKVAITLLHWWHNHLYSLPFSLSTSISPSLSLSTMLPHQFLGANAKSQSGVSVSCSYLTNTNPDSLPVFVSVFVKSPMLEMPVKKQNWTRWCFASAWLGVATSPCRLLCHWNICCLDLQCRKPSSERKLAFETLWSLESNPIARKWLGIIKFHLMLRGCDDFISFVT